MQSPQSRGSIGSRDWASSFVTSIAAAALLIAWASTDRAAPPDFDAACTSGSPWFVGSLYMAQTGSGARPSSEGSSLVLFRDTPDDGPHYGLTTLEETGALWGVGYSRVEGAVYAAAYHKRFVPFGPGGTGAIYRVNLATGAAELAFKIPDSGTDRHDPPRPIIGGYLGPDRRSAQWVGRTSLGDIEVSDTTSELFVTNLFDRRIHRHHLPDGAPLGSFDHGASGEAWSDSARPFALAIDGDDLYHGVVNEQGVGSSFVAVVYRSALDGSDMREVGRVRLDYARGSELIRTPFFSGRFSLGWRRWMDITDEARADDLIGTNSMPMLTDVGLADDGSLVLALRDRRWDMLYGQYRSAGGTSIENTGIGFGDVLIGEAAGERWVIETSPEGLDDGNALGFGESALGGVATVIGGEEEPSIVATAFGVERDALRAVTGLDGAYWYAPDGVNKRSHEVIAAPGSILPYLDLVSRPDLVFADNEGDYLIGSLGDIETVCSTLPQTATAPPTDTRTSTPSPSSTPTRYPTATPTAAPTATPTDAPGPQPIFMPISLTEDCDPTRVRADVALVIDASSSMDGLKLAAAKAAALTFIETLSLPDDRVGVAAFSRDSRVVHLLSGDRESLETAIGTIEMSPGTRIDRGLLAGLDVLADARGGAASTSALVLLTDGIQEAEPETPGAAADRIRSRGVVLHVVGLGADVDRAFLRELAAAEDRLHLSPGPDELEAIYTGIARNIPCPATAYWGRR